MDSGNRVGGDRESIIRWLKDCRQFADMGNGHCNFIPTTTSTQIQHHGSDSKHDRHGRLAAAQRCRHSTDTGKLRGTIIIGFPAKRRSGSPARPPSESPETSAASTGPSSVLQRIDRHAAANAAGSVTDKTDTLAKNLDDKNKHLAGNVSTLRGSRDKNEILRLLSTVVMQAGGIQNIGGSQP
jgi:hypothetical protein